MRIAGPFVITCLCVAASASAQIPAQSPPAFEVASVKSNSAPARKLGEIRTSPDTLTVRDVPLWLAVRWAYGVESFELSAPDWMKAPPFYDILAKTSGPVPQAQMRLMLRTLLAERFHLTVHREKKELKVMALLVAKDGPKFQASTGVYDPSRGIEMPMQFLGYDNTVHMQRRLEPGGRFHDSFTNIPMKIFASVVAMMGSRSPFDTPPVVDMTGLEGRYDVIFDFEPPLNHAEGDSQVPDDTLAAFKPILEKNLGLILESRKAAVEILVVDHADKAPTPN